MSGPRRVADLATLVLPSWLRDRYAAEFHAELAELAYAARWTHALGLLVTAPVLRTTLLRDQAVAAGFEPTIGCLLGVRHRWARAWTDDGRRYQRCRRCGVDRAPSGAGSGDYLSPSAWPR